MLRSISLRRLFYPHVRHDRRNSAALLDVHLRMSGSQRGLDNLDTRRGNIVFRPEGNQRAASMEYVADQLERGSTHAAALIDAQSDVVYGFAAMHRFGN